jgi:hypothetical protein
MNKIERRSFPGIDRDRCMPATAILRAEIDVRSDQERNYDA